MQQVMTSKRMPVLAAETVVQYSLSHIALDDLLTPAFMHDTAE
jgi:hypothetical protein